MSRAGVGKKSWRCVFSMHEWGETSRSSLSFDVVKYVCLREFCGALYEQWEHPNEGEYSLDKRVKEEQRTELLARAERERQRYHR